MTARKKASDAARALKRARALLRDLQSHQLDWALASVRHMEQYALARLRSEHADRGLEIEMMGISEAKAVQ